MLRLIRRLRHLERSEEGHAAPFFLAVVAVAGTIALGIGASGDSSIVAIIGGVVLGVGVVAAGTARHRMIDYDIYKRLDDLEK